MITVRSAVLSKKKIEYVDVQVALYRRAFPQLIVTGLPSSAVRESRERVLTTFREMQLRLPRGRYVVHLQPAGIRKDGTWLDCAIWLGLYLSMQPVTAGTTQSYFCVGELGLDGALSAPRGCLAVLDSAFRESSLPQNTQYIFPASLLQLKYRWPQENQLFPVHDMREVQAVVLKKNAEQSRKIQERVSVSMQTQSLLTAKKVPEGFQISPLMLRRCLIALAGGHSLLLFGSPGQGKTYTEHIFRQLIADSSAAEREKRLVQFDAGAEDSAAVVVFPHTVRRSALLRWQQLASGRVCIADELPLWEKASREALHGLLEIGEHSSSQENESAADPWICVATANPCPCGFFGESRCRCSEYERNRYAQKLSGPLLDRLCMQFRVSAKPAHMYVSEDITAFQEDIRQARDRQQRRGRQQGWPQWSVKYAWEAMRAEVAVPAIVERSIANWSFRRQVHFLQVAYTLCDLFGDGTVPGEKEIWEAVEFVRPSVEWK